MPFATPRHECQTHAAWQTTQWHRETQASTLTAQRHIHQHESVWDTEWRAVSRDQSSSNRGPGLALAPTSTWKEFNPRGRLQSPEGGCPSPLFMQQHATAGLQADTQGGTLRHRRLRISLSFHNYHFFEGVAWMTCALNNSV